MCTYAFTHVFALATLCIIYRLSTCHVADMFDTLARIQHDPACGGLSLSVRGLRLYVDAIKFLLVHRKPRKVHPME